MRFLARAALAALLMGCAFISENNPIAGGELTTDKEREVTADVARQIRELAPLVTDPVVLAYVNDLGQRIVATTEPQPFIYRFNVIEDDSLNAFTIGGGYVYLNTGVIQQAGNESELVGVISHEVGHVRKRHIAKRNEDKGIATLVTIAAMAAVALGGGDPSLLAMSQGVNVALQLQNSREAEAEADREAIAYMIRAGYDPNGVTRFFERLVAAYPDPIDIPPYLFTHPDVRERVIASRVEIERVDAPHGLKRNSLRLALIQSRLAQLLSPVAGGSGLQSRAEFDRSITDPLLAAAREEQEAGRDAGADVLLAQAEQREPNDPRVHLMRADLAEDRRDWEQARVHLQRAFVIDPEVPLVQYRLGLVETRLGNRSAAVFHLEGAAAGFRPGSPARERAEFEIERLTFEVFDESGLHREGDGTPHNRFARGETVVWEGDLSDRFVKHNPEFEVHWIRPDGQIARRVKVHMGTRGHVSSRLDTSEAEIGKWAVEVFAGDSPVSWETFQVVDGPTH